MPATLAQGRAGNPSRSSGI